MKAYVVRLGAEHRHPREIVGFFFAEDRRQLYDMIDECCDVEGCEVLALEPGGIFWSSATDYDVPLSPEMRTEGAHGLPGDAIATIAGQTFCLRKTKTVGNPSRPLNWLLHTDPSPGIGPLNSPPLSFPPGSSARTHRVSIAA